MAGRSRSRSRSPHDKDRRDSRNDRERDRRDDRDRDNGRDRERESYRGGDRDREYNRDRREIRDSRDFRDQGRAPMPPMRMDPRADPRRPSTTAPLKPLEPIDREKTCPLLLRMFCKTGAHHREDEFANGRIPRDDELITHTWMDASFKELAALIREVWEDARLKGTRLDFALVYPMPTGQITMKPLGSVTIGRRANDDLVALGQTRFKIGDYIDVAVYPAAAAGAAGPGARRPREY